MTIDYRALPSLQHFFTDAIGNPLVGGYLYTYEAKDHNTKKSVAKSTDPDPNNPEDFFENPIELDSSGSIPVPYIPYWATDELYYIVLTDSTQNPDLPPNPNAIIRTWDNFGYIEDKKPSIEEKSYRNYILNSQYRFFFKDSYEQDDLTDTDKMIYIADSGWYFKRNNNTSEVNITFEKFVPGQTDVPYNPLYYLHFVSSGGGSGETTKDIGIKIDDVFSFSDTQVQIAFYGKSDQSNSVELIVTQHFGGDEEDVTVISTESLSATWQQKIVSITIPSIENKEIDYDDNYITIAIRAPLNSVSDFELVNWQLNIGDKLFVYDYRTKDIEQGTQRAYQMEPMQNIHYGLNLIATPPDKMIYDFSPVGQMKTYFYDSLKYHLLCDGSSYSTVDTIDETNNILTYGRLYDKLDSGCNTGFSDWYVTDGNFFGFGEDGFFPYSKWDSNVVFYNTKIKTDITEWSDNNTGFTFAKNQTGLDIDLTSYYGINNKRYPEDIVFSNTSNNIKIINDTVGNVTDITIGNFEITNPVIAVSVIQQGSPTLPEASSITVHLGLDSEDPSRWAGRYITFNTTTVPYYMWFTVDGVGTDPSVGGKTAIRVDLSSWMDNIWITYTIYHAFQGLTSNQITFTDGSTLQGGEYFNIHNSNTHYVIYITVDGIGDDPKINDTKSVKVALVSDDIGDANKVRDKVVKSIKRIWFQVPDMRGLVLRGSDDGYIVNDIGRKAFTYSRGGFKSRNGKITGLTQSGMIQSHKHIIYPFYFDKCSYDGDGIQSLNDGTHPFDQTLINVNPYPDPGDGYETRMTNMSINFFMRY